MSWISYLFPQIVARYSTPYNKDIRVLEEQGKYKLLVNGSRQSGEYIRSMWQRAFTEFGIIPSPEVSSILVLGVAGGTVIELLRAIYPDAKITGVDIDKTMIELGKKYYGLAKLSSCEFVLADAKSFISRTDKKWDLIVVDVFIGASIPPFVAEEQFLKKLRNIVNTNGKILFNYLYEFEYKRLSDRLASGLRKHFSVVRDMKIYYNRFFFVVK